MDPAEVSAFNAQFVALQTALYGTEFTLNRQPVTLPFGRTLQEREIERYGFVSTVNAIAIHPDTVKLEIKVGDVLVETATRDEFRVEQVMPPTRAGGKKLGLSKLNPRK